MKKIISIISLFLFIFIFSLPNIAFSQVDDNKLISVSEIIVNKNDAKKIAENHIIREKYSAEFKDWINGKVDNGTELVDFNNNLIAYIFNVYDKTGPLGYVIVSANKNMPPILEYSRANSPYSIGLSKIKRNLQKNETIKKTSYVYFFPNTYIIRFTVDKNNYMQAEELVDVRNYKKFANKDINQGAINFSDINNVKTWDKLFDFNSMSSGTITTKKISGVADLTWYKGCAPTSAANLIYYWDSHGYPNLVTTETSNQVIEKLATYMGTDSSGSTNVFNIMPGTIQYIKSKGYTNFDGYNLNPPTYYDIRNEIDNSRPLLLSVIGHPTYKNHTMTCVGYEYTTELGQITEKYVIVHDTWSSTPADVYITFDGTFKYADIFIP